MESDKKNDIDHRMASSAAVKAGNLCHAAQVDFQLGHLVLSNAFATIESIDNRKLHQGQLETSQRAVG